MNFHFFPSKSSRVTLSELHCCVPQMYEEKHEQDKERYSGEKTAWGGGSGWSNMAEGEGNLTRVIFGEYLFICTFIYRQTQHRLQENNLLNGNWAECRVILWFLYVQTKYRHKVKLSINVIFYSAHKMFPRVSHPWVRLLTSSPASPKHITLAGTVRSDGGCVFNADYSSLCS